MNERISLKGRTRIIGPDRIMPRRTAVPRAPVRGARRENDGVPERIFVGEAWCPCIFPSSPRRGGRDLNKISRNVLYGADGVVIKFHRILLRLNTTPSPRAMEASQLFS